MDDSNELPLDTDEREQLRGRVLAGARPKAPAGRIFAVASAIVLIAVVTGAAWLSASWRGERTAASPSPSEAPSNPVGLWESAEVDGAYLLLAPDGTLFGGDGCNGVSGEWRFEERTQSVITWDGWTTLKICVMDEPSGIESGPPATHAPGPGTPLPTVLFPVTLQANGDTLHGVNADGDTVTLHRSPTVQAGGDSLLVTEAQPADAGDSALLVGVLTRTDGGCLGVGEAPVIFPYGARLHADGQGVDIEDGDTIMLGENVSIGGGEHEATPSERVLCGSDDVFGAYTVDLGAVVVRESQP
jgi:hypothetical protein